MASRSSPAIGFDGYFPRPRALNFDIYVYSGTGKYIDMYEWDSTGTWFLYFEEEPGEFYIEIDANNIYYWKAEVQILE